MIFKNLLFDENIKKIFVKNSKYTDSRFACPCGSACMLYKPYNAIQALLYQPSQLFAKQQQIEKINPAVCVHIACGFKYSDVEQSELFANPD